MRSLRRRPLLALILATVVGASIAAACSADPASPEPGPPAAVDPVAMNRQLGRGVNFGNALEAPAEGDWGITLAARHFERAAEAGFSTIRLPVRWSAHAAADPPYTVDAAFFERVDWAVDRALENDLNLILDSHHFEGLDASPAASRDRWLAVWRQVSARYRDRPPRVLFEIHSEPHDKLTPGLWNQYLRDAIAAIRETNPVRNLVVGPGAWNGIWALPQLSLPADGWREPLLRALIPQQG